MLFVAATGEYLSQIRLTQPAIPLGGGSVVVVCVVRVSSSSVPSIVGSSPETLKIRAVPKSLLVAFDVDDSGKAESSPVPLDAPPDSPCTDVPESSTLEKVRLLIACVLVIVHVSAADWFLWAGFTAIDRLGRSIWPPLGRSI